MRFFPNNINGNCKQVVLKISVVIRMKYKFLITCSILMKQCRVCNKEEPNVNWHHQTSVFPLSLQASISFF